LTLTILAAVSAAIAAPSRYYEDSFDFPYDSQTEQTGIIAYLLQIQAKERITVSPAPPRCYYEGSPDMGLSACGDDNSCCVIGWKLLCCKE